MGEIWNLQYGANVVEGGTEVRVWAPRQQSLAVKPAGQAAVPMERCADGDWRVVLPGIRAGHDYQLLTHDGRLLPDPVSRWQPEGVHGPTRIVNRGFGWTDADWRGIPLRDAIFYELHVGAFTADGTFAGVIAKLPYLRELGVTVIELMPVAEFPGARNWGYDGVSLYAPHSAYGGPRGLKQLVNAAHSAGIAVCLDVVYNHLGPEGNYLSEFGPYFTNHYRTPWGEAVNYDGAGSDGVRRYVIDNALYWVTEYHIDFLRLDAIHAIYDFSARHVLQEMAEEVHRQAELLGRKIHLVAESDLNDPRVLRAAREGGYAMDAQWHDDFHHSLYGLLTGDRRGYLGDFGSLTDLRKSVVEGFVYDGRYSRYRQRRHGDSSREFAGERFVAAIQNHDQVANTSHGKRLAEVASLDQQKLAAAILLFSPFLPLLFMGQEYGETAPFLYFTSHGDEALAMAVREGRTREFAEFFEHGLVPDPQAESTFAASRLDWSKLALTPHRQMVTFYRELLRLRREVPCLADCRKDRTRVECDETAGWMKLERSDETSWALLIVNFAGSAVLMEVGPAWSLALASGDTAYRGSGETVLADGSLTLGSCQCALLLATPASLANSTGATSPSGTYVPG